MNIGIVFQNPDHQIIFGTVEDEIGFGLKNLGYSKSEIKKKTNETLKKFNKSSWIGLSTATLSQGQRQLLCIMSVFAMDPAILILDETIRFYHLTAMLIIFSGIFLFENKKPNLG